MSSWAGTFYESKSFQEEKLVLQSPKRVASRTPTSLVLFPCSSSSKRGDSMSFPRQYHPYDTASIEPELSHLEPLD